MLDYIVHKKKLRSDMHIKKAMARSTQGPTYKGWKTEKCMCDKNCQRKVYISPTGQRWSSLPALDKNGIPYVISSG